MKNMHDNDTVVVTEIILSLLLSSLIDTAVGTWQRSKYREWSISSMLLNALLHPKSLNTRCYHAITFNSEVEASEQSISKGFRLTELKLPVPLVNVSSLCAFVY